MLRAKGFINLSSGSLGETTFMKINGKYTAREKVAISKDRIKLHPSYEMLRQNYNDFATCSVAGKTLRNAVSTLSKFAKDSEMVRRVQKQMGKVVRKTTTNSNGTYAVATGDITLFRGFNFNNKARLRATMNARYLAKIHRDTGELTIDIPSFMPVNAIKAPEGTTHFKIVSIGASVDFSTQRHNMNQQKYQSPMIPFDGTATTSLNILHQLPPDSPDTLVIILGLQFYKAAGEFVEPVKSYAANPLCIVEIE